jgi:hypothetical protein
MAEYLEGSWPVYWLGSVHVDISLAILNTVNQNFNKNIYYAEVGFTFISCSETARSFPARAFPSRIASVQFKEVHNAINPLRFQFQQEICSQ